MGNNVQLSFWGMSAQNTETYIDERVDDLYEQAKRLYKDGFAVLVIDASNVPEDLLGEVVEVLDFSFPEGEEEPLMSVSGIDQPVPLSAFVPVRGGADMKLFSNLNPTGISTKTAVMALASNAIEGVKRVPSSATSKLGAIKASQQAKGLKTKVAIVGELNEVEKLISDLTARGVSGVELDTALDYAAVLRSKL